MTRPVVLCLIVLHLTASVRGMTREHYIAIKEIEWNYAPSNKNVITGTTVEADPHASIYLKRGPTRIGGVYKKAVFLEYTDGSYNKYVPKANWLGFLGPVLKAEQGDKMIIHLKNFASRCYSIHPHGLTYLKAKEGALYPDNSTDVEKLDDCVQPGSNFSYIWCLTEDHAPTIAETDCVTRIYHSHTHATKDISTGLIGPLLICKKGNHLVHLLQDVDEEFALMFSVVDENNSWYLDQNIKKFCTTPSKVNRDDEDFQESNKMHSINGYVYGNLPGLSMFMGDKVMWHLFGMGNEVDIHSAYFHGNMLIEKHHHADTFSLFSASFITAVMVPTKKGKWLLSCQVNDHLEAGMQALFEVKDDGTQHKRPTFSQKERHYYIAAEEIIWDYGPTGRDQFTEKPLDYNDSDSAVYFQQGEKRIGGRYKKVVYQEYTDDMFTRQKERSPEQQHLGLLGPVIKAEVGDRVKVTFWNNASHSYSIQAHGVAYEKSSEGAKYPTDTGPASMSPRSPLVPPGQTFVYEWRIPEDYGPSRSEGDCLTWLYFSAVDPVKDTNSGLVGPLLICKPNTLDKKGKQKNVDKEMYMLVTVFDENQSWYLEENIQMFTGRPRAVDKEDEDFQESNKMHAINGYLFGNQPGLKMCKGDLVSWHMFGIGSEVDIHGIYFNGNTFLSKETRRDTVNIFPHISLTAIMQPDSTGVFDVACQTTDHFQGGMKQHYTVDKCSFWSGFPTFTWHTKTYYIAAVEIEWDYSPSRTWELEMYHSSEESPGTIYVVRGNTTIGSRYKKVVYREYTDQTFTKQKIRPAGEEHLEIQGPLLHAKVSDRIKIVFKNLATRPYSIHANGVKTNSQEVKPTLPETYIWEIPERSGPSPGDSCCISWAYYSQVDQVKDLFSGLIGTLVICRKSFLGLSKTHDLREFALLFMVFDENESWYLDHNIQTYCGQPRLVNTEDEDFIESNKMHAINGKLYGNLHGLEMVEGERAFWYLIGMGNEVDIHTAHFHGHSFDYKMKETYRGDVFDLFPGTFQTLEMYPQHIGTWLLHCHVVDHIEGGMETTYTVHKKPEVGGRVAEGSLPMMGRVGQGTWSRPEPAEWREQAGW
uniref:Ceruloplasmin n=1 Tax=Callorhinchus milii TaxID=7868 RepID=A0A4W3I8S3_CALMI